MNTWAVKFRFHLHLTKKGPSHTSVLQNFEKQVKHEFKRSIDKMSVFSSLSY